MRTYIAKTTSRSAALVALTIAAVGTSACAPRSFTTVDLDKAVPRAPVNGSLPLMPEGVPYGLPRAYLTMNVEWNGKADSAYNITFGDTVFAPDPNASYLLSYNPSLWFDDDVTLNTSGGLLSTINATTTDRSGDALKKVVEIVAEAGKLFTAFGDPPIRSGRLEYKMPTGPVSLSIQFDPFDNDSVKRLELRLAEVGLKVFAVQPNGRPLATVSSDEIPCDNSFCYRTATQIIIGVQGEATELKGQGKLFLAQVPDPSVTYALDVTRTNCVTRTTGVTFQSGMLSSLSINKPSEVSGCLQIPLDVLKAIVAVPGELLKFETGSLNDQKALLEAQTAVLNAEAALAEAIAAQAAAGGSDGQTGP